MISTFELTGHAAPRGFVTESYAWGISATFAGAALGNALGGAVAGSGPRAAMALAAGFGTVATSIALLRRGTLYPAPVDPTPTGGGPR